MGSTCFRRKKDKSTYISVGDVSNNRARACASAGTREGTFNPVVELKRERSDSPSELARRLVTMFDGTILPSDTLDSLLGDSERTE